jgi:hypothetical protein
MSQELIICPRCGEFIGEQGELDTCPLCDYDLTESEE